MTRPNDLIRRGSVLRAELADANKLVANGERVDLSHFEARIRGFCSAINLLASIDAQSFAAPLQEIILALEVLEKNVNTQLEQNRQRLARLENQQQGKH